MKKSNLIVLFIVICLLLIVGCKKVEEQKEEAQINHLTKEEIDSGWQLLFDGESTNGWHKFNDGKINGGWIIEKGAFVALGKGGDIGGDIVTDQEFENFDLKLEWKISPEGNSGIFYGVVEGKHYDALYDTGPEYQLIDDVGFPDKLEDWQKTGADYAMHLADTSKKKLAEVGKWNTSRIIVNDSLVQHYLNGEKIVEFIRWTKDWEVKKSEGKWKDFPDYGIKKKGKIGLQDHGHKIWFRNIKIKSL